MVRGRKPRATAVNELNGAYTANPGRRNKREPKFAPGAPTCPGFVRADSVAFDQWNHVVEVLSESGVLTQAERTLLSLYSVTYSQWLKYHKIVSEYGVESRADVSHYHKLSDRLIKLIVEFGLTPSGRTKLVSPKAEEVSPMADLLARMQGRN